MRRDSEEAISPTALFPPQPWNAPWTAAGVIELLEPMVGELRRQRIQAVLEHRKTSVTVLMDAPHDPHNGAAVLRSCDAFGVQRAHVIPREDHFLASNLVSKGAERWVDVVEHGSANEAAESLIGAGFELVATHPEGELVPEDLSAIPKLCLVMGNEHDGISEQLMKSAGRSVRIEMVGFVESLNVSVSAAILLRAATKNRPGDLTPQDRQRLYAQGLCRSLKRTSDILAAASPR